MRFFELLLPFLIGALLLRTGLEITTLEWWLWAIAFAFLGSIHDLAVKHRIKSNAESSGAPKS